MKKTVSIILTVVMLMLAIPALAVDYGAEYQKLPTPQTLQKFSDVPNTHWAFDYIGEMTQRDVISGYPDGRFLPENQVTRAEFAKIMVCAAGLTIKTPVTVDGSSHEEIQMNQPQGVGYNFGCVALSEGSWIWDVLLGDWYAPYVFTAVNYMNFYKNPYDDGLDFKPTTPALREDIAVALVKLKGYDISLADESILNMFTDGYSISTSARKYVAVAVERGIVSGYEDNTFRGQATITRAEAATLLWRAFQYGNDNKVTGNSTNTTGTEVSSSTQIVKPTEDPTVAQRPTPKPTEEPEPVEISKPYKIDTLVKANFFEEDYIEDYSGQCILKYTHDNDNNIYYIDKGVICRVSVPDGDTEKIFDTADLDIDDEEKTLSDFRVGSIFYDKHKNQLMICGCYESVNSANNVGYGTYLYVINENSAELVTDNFRAGLAIYGVLSNGDYICDHNSYLRDLGVFILDGETFHEKCHLTGNMWGRSVKVWDFIETDSEIYFFFQTGWISKYDYTDKEPLWSDAGAYSACILNDKVICLDGSRIVTYNFKGKKLSEIDCNDIKVVDKTELNFTVACGKLISINDNIVFYDTSAKAFRMISENN